MYSNRTHTVMLLSIFYTFDAIWCNFFQKMQSYKQRIQKNIFSHLWSVTFLLPIDDYSLRMLSERGHWLPFTFFSGEWKQMTTWLDYCVSKRKLFKAKKGHTQTVVSWPEDQSGNIYATISKITWQFRKCWKSCCKDI